MCMDMASCHYQNAISLLQEGAGESVLKAAHFMRKSADAGHASAAFEFAMMLRAGKGVPQDLIASRSYLELSDRLGMYEATYRLGQYNLYGIGGPENLSRARCLFLTASLAGDAMAMNQLGLMLIAGLGGNLDIEAGRQWWWRGAALGEHRCAFNLALSYFQEEETGTAHDIALYWLQQAHRLGSPTAGGLLGRMAG